MKRRLIMPFDSCYPRSMRSKLKNRSRRACRKYKLLYKILIPAYKILIPITIICFILLTWLTRIPNPNNGVRTTSSYQSRTFPSNVEAVKSLPTKLYTEDKVVLKFENF